VQRPIQYLLFFFLLIAGRGIVAQTTFEKSIYYQGDTLTFDTVSVYRSGFSVRISGNVLAPVDYYLDPIHCRLFIYKEDVKGTLLIQYERMPLNFSNVLRLKSTDLIVSDTVTNIDPFIYSISSANPDKDLFGSGKLNKQGSLSRGITVGNNQNLSFQSTLNLQLDGQVAPNLFMMGSITDDNIPFQPDGSTQKLQEFDQVYLKVYNDNFAVIGGDFWLRRPTGYFLNYEKRSQGASIEAYHPLDMVGLDGKASHKVAAAFSRGKFARNVVQGVEGNQGPYRLKGAENESYIVVLAGTEKVYIDGVLLTRGQEFDYVIDYNTAEVTFTANRLITKDKRIIVEFQYSSLSYARSLLSYTGEFTGKRYRTWVNVYSEQDAKNQSIQQTLTNVKKQILISVGDSLNDAVSNSIDSVGYFDSRVLYAMTDSLGIDSVLIFSVNPDSAFYQALFAYVGPNKGDYTFEKFTANGKVYRWVQPVAGVSQGDYAPVQVLIAPQKKQMFVVGSEFYLGKNITTGIEVAASNFDKNTFSHLHNQDNQGTAIRWNWKSGKTIGKNEKLRLGTLASFEFNQKTFEQIQWFRSPEFDRDWNVRNKPYVGHQYLSTAGLILGIGNALSVTGQFENYARGTDYNGYRNNLKISALKKGFAFKLDASYLTSDGQEKTDFLRHNSSLSQNIKFFKIGFEDIHEGNRQFLNGSDSLKNSAYRFYDWKVFAQTGDSSANALQIYYRERYDWFSDSVRLKQSTRARNAGLIAALMKNPDHTLRLNLNFRQLEVLDSILFSAAPENTILNRLEHNMRLWKGMITATTFYELGSGLELKREFVYIEVNSGQGNYTWNDYNGDGVKDLGEFEIAVFQDQGNYIRVFIPTNTYVRTYANQFSTSLMFKPDRLLRSEKKALRFLGRFSDQIIYKVNRKTSYEDGIEAFNPFVFGISDTNLVALTSNFRNTFFLNKTDPIFGLSYSYQENSSKVLLSNGFDSRLHTFHESEIRWNIGKYYNLRLNGSLGRKKSNSDYASGRNYYINYFQIDPVITWQPGSAFRIALKGKYAEKNNDSDLNEAAIIRNIGVELRLNQAEKGSFAGQLNFILIDYNASTNTSLAFEMLEGLKTGKNFTWGLSYQRKVTKSLQMNLVYNGRKSEGNKTIHSGGMELRAFF